MGGRIKGLLRGTDGQPLVGRLRALLESVGIGDIVLVGRHSAYEALGLPGIEDSPEGIGPLGGLISLMQRAAGSESRALAIACDMPFVSDSLVRNLLSGPDAAVLAPRRGELWEPLCALYKPDRVLAEARRRATGRDHSLQGLLNAVGAVELPLGADEAWMLADWDASEDVGNRS
jgi:molybdopterin-guanine dinucleotide biosynthesis protein A